jgi:hypothetical protein
MSDGNVLEEAAVGFAVVSRELTDRTKLFRLR